MSSGQQIIKILAIIFAIIIIVNIFGWVLFAASTFLGVEFIQGQVQETSKEEAIHFSKIYDNTVETVKIEAGISKLTVQTGQQLKVEGSNLPKKFTATVVGTTLIVKEEGNKEFWKNKATSELTITIPKDISLNMLEIDAGVGNSTISNITTDRLDLDCGVGNINIENLTVLSKTKIDGGAGKTAIKNSKLHYLDLDTGVGNISVEADITGNSEIDCGVGEVKIMLPHTKEQYAITTQTGIGKIKINDTNCHDGKTYGTGNNTIKISGGVGSVIILVQE